MAKRPQRRGVTQRREETRSGWGLGVGINDETLRSISEATTAPHGTVVATLTLRHPPCRAVLDTGATTTPEWRRDLLKPQSWHWRAGRHRHQRGNCWYFYEVPSEISTIYPYRIRLSTVVSAESDCRQSIPDNFILLQNHTVDNQYQIISFFYRITLSTINTR